MHHMLCEQVQADQTGGNELAQIDLYIQFMATATLINYYMARKVAVESASLDILYYQEHD